MPYRLLYILPKNWISFIAGLFVHSRLPFGLHTTLKNWFIVHYKVDCSDAEKPISQYETLGAFFVRKLKHGSRPLAKSTLISPVDGLLTQSGRFTDSEPRLTQIKGINYSLRELVGSEWNLSDYGSGGFLTIYLAPYNYHRIHSPIEGRVTQVTYIPGALWPVNTWSVSHIPGLFVVNERVIVEVQGPLGKALVVMVGATNVGRITLDFYDGIVGNAIPRVKNKIWKPSQSLPIAQGQGLGCFELGSTVILILSKELAENLPGDILAKGSKKIRMGEGFAT